MVEQQDEVSHPWHVPRLIVAWVSTLLCGVLVLVCISNEARFHWLVLALGVSTLLTFALQLGTAQREGFISRTAVSLAGSVAIILLLALLGVTVFAA